MRNCAKYTKEVEIKKKMKKEEKKISTFEKPDFMGLVSYTRSYTHYTHFNVLKSDAFFDRILNKCFVKL